MPKSFLAPAFCLVGPYGKCSIIASVHFSQVVKERAFPSEERTVVTQNFAKEIKEDMGIRRLCRRREDGIAGLYDSLGGPLHSVPRARMPSCTRNVITRQ